MQSPREGEKKERRRRTLKFISANFYRIDIFINFLALSSVSSRGLRASIDDTLTAKSIFDFQGVIHVARETVLVPLRIIDHQSHQRTMRTEKGETMRTEGRREKRKVKYKARVIERRRMGKWWVGEGKECREGTREG